MLGPVARKLDETQMVVKNPRWFGVVIIIIGLLFFWPTYRTEIVLWIMGGIFIIIGISLFLYICELELDFQERTYRYRKGFIVSNVQHGTFDDFKCLEYRCFLQSRASDSRGSYPVWSIDLVWKDKKKIELCEFEDQGDAYERLESLSEKIKLRVFDKTCDKTVIIEPGEFNLVSRERSAQRNEAGELESCAIDSKTAKQKDSNPLSDIVTERSGIFNGKIGDILPECPTASRILHTVEKNVLHFIMPKAGFNLGVIIPAFFSCLFIGFGLFVIRAVLRSHDITPFGLLLPAAFVAFGCFVFLFAGCFPMFAEQHLLIASDNVSAYTSFLKMKFGYKTAQLDTIRAINLERTPEGVSFVYDIRRVSIRADEIYIKFGQTLNASEKKWMVDVLNNIIFNYLVVQQS